MNKKKRQVVNEGVIEKQQPKTKKSANEGAAITVMVVRKTLSTHTLDVEEFSCHSMKEVSSEIKRRYHVDMKHSFIAPILDEDNCSYAGMIEKGYHRTPMKLGALMGFLGGASPSSTNDTVYRMIIDSPKAAPRDYSFAVDGGEP